MAKKGVDQPCPIARTLEIVGARWTLLILRDLLRGTMRFQDLQESLPGIAPNVLSDRLKTLEAHGLVRRDFYTDHPPRAAYSLTGPGRELGVVVIAIGMWGVNHLGVKLNKGFQHEECRQHLKRATEALLRHPVQPVKAASKTTF